MMSSMVSKHGQLLHKHRITANTHAAQTIRWPYGATAISSASKIPCGPSVLYCRLARNNALLHYSMGAFDDLACLETVNRAAIRALGLASSRHIQIHFGMPTPSSDPRLGVGTGEIALMVKILGL